MDDFNKDFTEWSPRRGWLIRCLLQKGCIQMCILVRAYSWIHTSCARIRAYVGVYPEPFILPAYSSARVYARMRAYVRRRFQHSLTFKAGVDYFNHKKSFCKVTRTPQHRFKMADASPASQRIVAVADDEENLIFIVQTYKFLYRTDCSDYKDAVKEQNAWLFIGQELGNYGERCPGHSTMSVVAPPQAVNSASI